MRTYCTKQEALTVLEAMDDIEFNRFVDKCPIRVQILLKGNMVNWRDVLPEWYTLIPY